MRPERRPPAPSASNDMLSGTFRSAMPKCISATFQQVEANRSEDSAISERGAQPAKSALQRSAAIRRRSDVASGGRGSTTTKELEEGFVVASGSLWRMDRPANQGQRAPSRLGAALVDEQDLMSGVTDSEPRSGTSTFRQRRRSSRCLGEDLSISCKWARAEAGRTRSVGSPKWCSVQERGGRKRWPLSNRPRFC